MAQIATSINQSKTLIELGIDMNTADMYYGIIDDANELNENNYLLYINKEVNWNEVTVYDRACPAWSLSALIELMPEHIVINNKMSNSLKIYKEEEGVGFSYFFSAIDKVDDIVICDMTPIDAAFEMVCYLLENKLIN